MLPVVDETANLATVYAVYAVVSAGLTVWLARILGQNGQVFLEDVFVEKPDLADAVNKLLVVGFYLVNFGYALLLLRGGHAPTLVTAIEALSMKLGSLLLSLAFMHFFNLVVLHRIRRKAIEERQTHRHPYRHAYAGPRLEGWGSAYAPLPSAADEAVVSTRDPEASPVAAAASTVSSPWSAP